MKKILLGLLALSTTLMAGSTGLTGNAGENQIDITTKAFIVDSGLIITESDTNGATAIKSVELDHGTIMKTNAAASTVSRDIYIKKSNGLAFPTNTILEVKLTSTDNNLKNTATPSENIPHKLTASVDANHATSSKQSLVLVGDEATSASEFSTQEEKTAIKVNLKSEIAAGVIAKPSLTLSEGAYTNISTLSVKFSKVPTVTGAAADKSASR